MASRLFIKRTASYTNAFLKNQIYNSRSYASEMAFTFASPSEVFYNKSNVRQVDVPSYSGSFGILPSHVPTLAVLKPGVVTVYEEDGGAKKFFGGRSVIYQRFVRQAGNVSSGSVTINEDSSVQVLAQEAFPVEKFDAQACREGLAKAQQQLGSAATEEAKAEAQIAIEVNEELVKATS